MVTYYHLQHHHRLSISKPNINLGTGEEVMRVEVMSVITGQLTEQSDLSDGYLTGTGGLEDWTSQT